MDPIDFHILSSDSSYASDVSDDGSATESVEKLPYKCKYCPKRYSKTQALGGHQNAHKKEREITERQGRDILTRTNHPDPVPYPYPYPYPYPKYALPPGFERPRFKVDGPDDQDVVYNQYTAASSSSDLAKLRIDPSQEMGRGWIITGNPYQPVMAQSQHRPVLPAPSSSVCLDLCLGVGSSSQVQTRSKEPTDEMKVTAKKEDDDLSLSLSLKL